MLAIALSLEPRDRDHLRDAPEMRQGMTPEELVSEFPHLTLAQVYDALSYYYDHKDHNGVATRALP